MGSLASALRAAGPHGGGRARCFVIILLRLLLSATAASVLPPSPPTSPASYTQLTFGSWAQGVVNAGDWMDFYVVAESDEASIEFEVVADTGSPAAVSIFVTDAGVPTMDSRGAPFLSSSTVLHDPEAQRASGRNAAALDSDYVSRIGNQTHRHFYGYVSHCYAQKGYYYFLSVYGQSFSTTAFEARAVSTSAALPLGETKGQVCDGKYAHHYIDVSSHVHSGGLEFKVAKTSGALENWGIRLNKCGGFDRDNLYSFNLFGHGLATDSKTLPNADTSLDAGRYHVTIRGSLDLCGLYTITITNLTQAQVAQVDSSS